MALTPAEQELEDFLELVFRRQRQTLQWRDFEWAWSFPPPRVCPTCFGRHASTRYVECVKPSTEFL